MDCSGIGEVGAVLKEALICLAPGLPSTEYFVYSREFFEVVGSV